MMEPDNRRSPGEPDDYDDYDETWHATLAGEFDTEPDLNYFPGEDWD